MCMGLRQRCNCARARNASRLRAPIVLEPNFAIRVSKLSVRGSHVGDTIQYFTDRDRLFSDDGSNLKKWKDVKSKRGSGDVGEEGKQSGNDSLACANTYMMWCD
jgi:hypothetical protein